MSFACVYEFVCVCVFVRIHEFLFDVTQIERVSLASAKAISCAHYLGQLPLNYSGSVSIAC
jgi:dTDP-4-amino-4,6-dideoxygalactose transaminase